MSIVFDVPAVMQLVNYILLPIFIILIIFSLGLVYYAFKHKTRKTPKYYYNVNLWSSLLAIIVTAVLVAISLGFGLSFAKQMDEFDLVGNYQFLYYFYLALPIVPFGFLLYFGRKFIRTLRSKPLNEEEKHEEAFEEPEAIIEEKHEQVFEEPEAIVEQKPVVEVLEEPKEEKEETI